MVIKVKSSPVEADGKVPRDFGLVRIPPLGFDCNPAAAEARGWLPVLHQVAFYSSGTGPGLYLTN